MTNNNPFNFVPLKPTGRNDTDNVNTYAPKDMMRIYEQQFVTQVPEDKLTEFLPALKAFYDIDDNTLDISAVIFDAIADAAIIYNHKIKAGDYQILGDLVKEQVEPVEDKNDIKSQAYTLDCMRVFYINDVKLSYYFNLFVQGDGYSTLPSNNNLLEKLYWFVSAGFDKHVLDDSNDIATLESINEELVSRGITAMDLNTVHEIVVYIEDNIIDDKMVEVLNTLLDEIE